MEKKLENTLEEINPKRRAFVKTLLHASYVVPTVIQCPWLIRRLILQLPMHNPVIYPISCLLF